MDAPPETVTNGHEGGLWGVGGWVGRGSRRRWGVPPVHYTPDSSLITPAEPLGPSLSSLPPLSSTYNTLSPRWLRTPPQAPKPPLLLSGESLCLYISFHCSDLFSLHLCPPHYFPSRFPPFSWWQMGFNKSWQSDEIKGVHLVVGYSSTPLTYLKQGLNSEGCPCLTSPGHLTVIAIIITAWHCIVVVKKIAVPAGTKGDKRLAAPSSLCQQWPL